MAIIVDNIRVFNFEGAIRGMRNPLESWEKSDSNFGLDSFDWEIPENWEIVNKWVKTKTEAKSFSEEYENFYKEFDSWLTQQGILFKNQDYYEFAFIGPEDMKLMQKLIKAGADESKFMRQIMISMDIEAPLYW